IGARFATEPLGGIAPDHVEWPRQPRSPRLFCKSVRSQDGRLCVESVEVVTQSGQNAAITVCLVADDEVIDRFPGLVRFLQVGLIDEPVEFVLVAPDVERTDLIVTGSTRVVRYRNGAPLFRRFWQRGIVSD